MPVKVQAPPQQAREGVRSASAASLLADLMGVGPGMRREFMTSLSERELQQVLIAADREMGTPFGLWRDDPVGFIEQALGETMWSVPKQIMRAAVHNKRVVVPSCFASGKTWSAARLVLWKTLTQPVGPALVVTIAPKWSHVHRNLWPEIRGTHSRAGLPGQVDMAQMKMWTRQGLEKVVAYGMAVQPWNATGVQGIHAPILTLIVDEAGGMAHAIGQNLSGMLVGESDTNMLAIGNPPTDEEGGWFEQLCDNEDAVTIPISAYSTPALTGEVVPQCKSCPPELSPHPLTKHLVTRKWVEDAIRDNGGDSNFVTSKVHARFPQGGPGRAIPNAWIEAAENSEEPAIEAGRSARLCDLGLTDERDAYVVSFGAWIRLGVDVAADGGDTFAISRLVGDCATMEHKSSGPANANAVEVAGVVLAQIRRAEALRRRLGTEEKVRVKIDAIGVGWGVVGILKAWGTEQRHDAEIIAVVVSEGVNREPDSATLRPYRQRDELWLSGRANLQPSEAYPDGRIRIRCGGKVAAQLRAPTMSTNMTGFTVIESKKSLKARGLKSPDEAEAFLLAAYEPGEKKRKRAKLITA